MQNKSMYHLPVMLNECIEGLDIIPNGIYVDVTFGGGGHSKAILEKLNKDGKLFAFDVDDDAQKNIINDERFTLIQANFRHIKKFLRVYNVTKVNGILADFGISSHQIDVAERGFATRFDGELDMRMDRRSGISAKEVVNTYSAEQLTNILGFYGEVPNAKTLAKAIVDARIIQPIETTQQLINIAKPLARGIDAKYYAQVFQAIRIEVNQEIEVIKELLEQSKEILEKDGRLVTMSYHSLEDRLVKNYIKNGVFENEPTKDLYGNFETYFKLINKKPIEASTSELKINKRARSAKLRIAQKI